MLLTAEGCAATVHELLQAGADLARKDNSGQTAVDIAHQSYEVWKSQADEYTTPHDQESYRQTLQAKADCLKFLQQAS